MVKQLSKAPSKPRYDHKTNLYQLKFSKIVLESDSRSYFYLRKNELLRINGRILPVNIKFVIQDETLNKLPELVNVKVILERIDIQEFSITFEESTKVKRWSDKLTFNQYYEQRLEQLRSRQFNVFDIVIQRTYNDGNFFLIQYSVYIPGVNSEQINKLVRKSTEAVHASSEAINNSFFINF